MKYADRVKLARARGSLIENGITLAYIAEPVKSHVADPINDYLNDEMYMVDDCEEEALEYLNFNAPVIGFIGGILVGAF